MVSRSSYIYKYNLITENIDSVCIKSEFIYEKDIIPFNENFFYQPNYYNQAIEYGLRTSKFYAIFFNKNRKEFYRVNIIKSPSYNSDGKKNKWYNWSVSVIDTNLNLIGEIPFLKDSLYNFYNFIPSSKGFIVAYKQTEEDKRLKRTRLCEFEISY